MSEPGDHRGKLLQQKQALERKLAGLDARERESERKRETRRKIITGAIVLKHAQENPSFAKTLFTLLDRFVLKRDRHLFELPESSTQTEALKDTFSRATLPGSTEYRDAARPVPVTTREPSGP